MRLYIILQIMTVNNKYCLSPSTNNTVCVTGIYYIMTNYYSIGLCTCTDRYTVYE